MKQAYDIALLKGDGIGPEIIDAGVKVLNAAAEVGGKRLNFVGYPYGSEHYLKTKEILSENAIGEFKDSDAIYFGAIGDPRVEPGILEVNLILRIRFALDQYINLRPVKLYPNVECPLKNINTLDFYMVRENTEDFYNGMGACFDMKAGEAGTANLKMERKLYNASLDVKASFSSGGRYAINMGLISEAGAERIMRYSFELAKRKGKTKVTSVDKKNVLPQIYGLWRETFEKVAAEYPGITTESSFVDAMTMWLVKNPENYGVIVAPNLFGDIITDLGAAISGGLGFAAGANINPEGTSMFEPIHGSAPKYKGLNVANPVATILSGALMLDEIGEPELGNLVDNAITEAMAEGLIKTKDMGGQTGTAEVGDIIARKVYDLGQKK